MEYTVKQLARLAGISVRTLHYYDEIGLLKPTLIKDNGYRSYKETELLKLQQILFFKELEFPLETIKRIMESPQFDSLAALEDQHLLLEVKKKHLEQLLSTIAKTIHSLKGGEPLPMNDTFSAFQDLTYQQYKDEVQQRWGTTDAYKQSLARMKRMSKADLEKIKAESQDITQTTANLYKEGYAFDSQAVQTQIDRFYQYLHHFYDPNYEMFKGLGQMYVDDQRFAKFYDDQVPGLAAFMRDAMAHYAAEHLK